MKDIGVQYFVWGAIAILLVAAGWFYYADVVSKAAPAPDAQGVDSTPMPVPGSNVPEMVVEPDASQSTGATVAYTTTGFVPQSVTIRRGESVTFIDQSGRGMWVASAVHPTHAAYSGMTLAEHCPDTAGVAFDQCAAGGTYTFTFTKAGTWRYHNHLTGGDPGTVIVQ